MNPTQKLLLRHALLLQLQAASPVSLPPDTLRQGAALAGFRLTDDELQAELDYLAEKNFMQVTLSPLSHGLPRSRLTAKGREYLEKEGLI